MLSGNREHQNKGRREEKGKAKGDREPPKGNEKENKSPVREGGPANIRQGISQKGNVQRRGEEKAILHWEDEKGLRGGKGGG